MEGVGLAGAHALLESTAAGRGHLQTFTPDAHHSVGNRRCINNLEQSCAEWMIPGAPALPDGGSAVAPELLELKSWM